MSTFHLYLNLGLGHIADFKGYDHILFIITLIAVYQIQHWKKILILVTAFTIGHSLTLVLATLDLVRAPIKWVEFLIPVTIFLTAIGNILQKKTTYSIRHHIYKYALALFFGLIHGLGFSTYLRSILSGEGHLVFPVFSFNVGIELGQLLIVSIFLTIGVLFMRFLKVNPREWNLFFSGAGFGVSLILMFERFPL